MNSNGTKTIEILNKFFNEIMLALKLSLILSVFFSHAVKKPVFGLCRFALLPSRA